MEVLAPSPPILPSSLKAFNPALPQKLAILPSSTRENVSSLPPMYVSASLHIYVFSFPSHLSPSFFLALFRIPSLFFFNLKYGAKPPLLMIVTFKPSWVPLIGQLSHGMFLREHPKAHIYPVNGHLYAVTRYGRATINTWMQHEDQSWTNIESKYSQ